uniref:Uncharacterized protein n=1 Tax=Arundo donax TaxID=35708 RepID=A0A0A9GV22_ARUDO
MPWRLLTPSIHSLSSSLLQDGTSHWPATRIHDDAMVRTRMVVGGTHPDGGCRCGSARRPAAA